MEGNVQIRPGGLPRKAIRKFLDRQSIERVVAAIGAILVTNLLKFLLSIKIVSTWVFRILDLLPSKIFYNNLRYIVIVILLVSYGVILYLLHKRFAAVMSRSKRVRYSLLTGVGMLALFLLNVFFLPRAPGAAGLVPKKLWSDHIIESQAPNGGIREKPLDAGYQTQVWTTAQALVAVLSDQADLDDKKIPAVKSAFSYIEAARHPGVADSKPFDEGWGLFESSQKSVTEICGWVTVANVASIESAKPIWNTADTEIMLTRIQRDLKLIVERQDETGGWRPIKENGPDFTRTYSTAIALWALAEARASKRVYQVIGNTYDTNISRGVNWLLMKYTKEPTSDGAEQKLGWVPNPNRRGQREQFSGLTAQVLYVLSRIESQPGFESLKRDPSYLDYKTAFVRDSGIAQRFVCSNDRIHDYDLSFVGNNVEFVLEGSTLLWFPWSYVELTNLANDSALSPQDRTAAANLSSRILDSRVDDLNKFVEAEFMYVVAENLYCLSMSKKVMS